MPPDTPTTTTRSRSMALLERRLGPRVSLAVRRPAAPAGPVVGTAPPASRDDAQLVLALARRRDQCGQLHAFSCRCGSVLRRAAYPLTPRASCNVLRNPVPMRARVLGVVDGEELGLRAREQIVHDDVVVVHPLRPLAPRVAAPLTDHLGTVGAARDEARAQRLDRRRGGEHAHPR